MILLTGVQLLTAIVGFLSAGVFCGAGFFLMKFLHLWTTDVGWLGCIYWTRSIISRCTVYVVSQGLLE